MTGIEIRLVREGEHAAVDELVERAYEHDYGPRDPGADPFRKSVNRSQSTDVWVAVEGDSGRLLGSVTAPREGGGPMHEDVHPDELDFRLLAVAPDARRLGIGALLTLHVIRLARERGFRAVFMKSGPDMTGAHRLYERIGFERDLERAGLIRDGVRVRDLHAFAIRVDAVAEEYRDAL